MKLYYAAPEGETPLLLSFLDTLEEKLRQKLYQQFAMLLTAPLPREPIIKHFSISKYSQLYELRAKSKVMVRIIFTIRDNGDILLLVPFIKKSRRNTMQALDASLKLLARINTGTCSIAEMS